jgi:hypothetical protein
MGGPNAKARGMARLSKPQRAVLRVVYVYGTVVPADLQAAFNGMVQSRHRDRVLDALVHKGLLERHDTMAPGVYLSETPLRAWRITAAGRALVEGRSS